MPLVKTETQIGDQRSLSGKLGIQSKRGNMIYILYKKIWNIFSIKRENQRLHGDEVLTYSRNGGKGVKLLLWETRNILYRCESLRLHSLAISSLSPSFLAFVPVSLLQDLVSIYVN